MSTNLAIDIHVLPSSPSSPLWESPNKPVTRLGDEHGPILIAPIQSATPLGEALNELSRQLTCFIWGNSAVADLEKFLDQWRVPMVDENETCDSRVHPLVLEWFSKSNAIQGTMRSGRIDLLKTLFKYGLKLDEHHMSTLMDVIVRTGDIAMLEIALEQGWDINAPAIYGPPVLG
jgi:hypothetical protein